MIKGWGSAPVVRDDGSLVIAASGGRVGAWSSAGHSLQGWPVSGVDMATGCDTGSTPIAAGGGAVVVLGDKAVTMLDAHGAVAAGWPVHLSDPVARTCMSCTPGPADPISPVVTSAGIYVPLYARLGGQVRIAVFGLDGRPAASWDGLIGVPGDELISLQAAPDGAVWAVARHPDSTGPRDSLVLVGSRQAAP